ncbi:Hypp1368 [Branchiostoma lanceolatum]|uniref:Hypp1368 protein n=1 Tax=Branchiostoma lanceolatum TaxID=7740 RepID=A0A8J9ZKA3_BRALA|nr:Hypp1368 [Branchiostoma lanceolatum]
MFAARGALAGTRLARERRRKLREARARARRRKQRRPKTVIIHKGTVKICSFPTAWILFGLFVFGAGTVMSMVSYDFLEVEFLMINNITQKRPESTDFDQIRGIQDALFQAGYPDNVYDEYLLRGINYPPQFRLVGPLLIGGGIFIMLCGITALLENRDGETIRAPVIVLDPATGQPGHHFDGYKSRFANFDEMLSNSCPNLKCLPQPPELNQQRGYLKHPPSPAPLHSLFPRRKVVRTPRKSYQPIGLNLSEFQQKANISQKNSQPRGFMKHFRGTAEGI